MNLRFQNTIFKNFNIKSLHLLTFLFLIPFSSQCQHVIDTCQKSKTQALLDFKRENIKYLVKGLVKFENPDKERYYRLYLLSEFNIKTEFTGCIVSEDLFCYSATMDSLVDIKYGKNFYHNLKNQIKANYLKLTKDEKLKVLNNRTLYDEIDLEEKPSLNKDLVIGLFKKSVKYKYLKSDAFIFINENNKIYDLKLYEVDCFHEFSSEQKNVLINILNDRVNPKSGKIYGRAVKSKIMLKI